MKRIFLVFSAMAMLLLSACDGGEPQSTTPITVADITDTTAATAATTAAPVATVPDYDRDIETLIRAGEFFKRYAAGYFFGADEECEVFTERDGIKISIKPLLDYQEGGLYNDLFPTINGEPCLYDGIDLYKSVLLDVYLDEDCFGAAAPTRFSEIDGVMLFDFSLSTIYGVPDFDGMEITEDGSSAVVMLPVSTPDPDTYSHVKYTLTMTENGWRIAGEEVLG